MGTCLSIFGIPIAEDAECKDARRDSRQDRLTTRTDGSVEKTTIRQEGRTDRTGIRQTEKTDRTEFSTAPGATVPGVELLGVGGEILSSIGLLNPETGAIDGTTIALLVAGGVGLFALSQQQSGKRGRK